MAQDQQSVSSSISIPPGWMDRDGAARALGISPATFKRWCGMGRVRHGRWIRRGRGRCKIYPIDEVRRLLNEDQKQPRVLKEDIEAGRHTPASDYITRDEACQLLGIGRTTWIRWESRGHVPRGTWAKGYHEKPWHRVYSLEQLRQIIERLERVGQPYPDPDQSGCWRVPVMSFRDTVCEAIIDADDLPRIQGNRWNWLDRTDGYDGVVVLARRDDVKTPMRHIILGLECSGWRISHANGDPLDCRRSNLVARNISEHSHRAGKMHKRGGEPCTSGFKGVSWDDSRKKWRATIKKDGQVRFLGRFDDEIAAAEAYDQAARELFGEHARLNFPDADESGAAPREPIQLPRAA